MDPGTSTGFYLVGVMVMILGVGLFGSLTGFIANKLLAPDSTENYGQEKTWAGTDISRINTGFRIPAICYEDRTHVPRLHISTPVDLNTTKFSLTQIHMIE